MSEIISRHKIYHISLDDVLLYAVCNDSIERKLQKCIIVGMTIFKVSFGEVYRRIYGPKWLFTGSLASRRKTKFPTLYPTIYVPK